MTAGGIVLCGGRSSRMGAPKALLPFGPETMLQRVVRLVGSVAAPVVVAAARGQELPDLPDTAIVTRDESDDQGPLAGLRAAWNAMPEAIDTAYVTSCDVPLLKTEFIARMVDLAAGYEIAVPEVDGFAHPLSGVHRRETLRMVEAMLARGELRVTRLMDLAKTRRVRAEEIADVDPEFLSLRNLNTRDDYLEALRRNHLRTT